MSSESAIPARHTRLAVTAGSVADFRVAGQRPWRGVVVSTDEYNATGANLIVAPLHRASTHTPTYVGTRPPIPVPAAVPALVVVASEYDPISGVISIPHLTHVDPSDCVRVVGILTGATMFRIRYALTSALTA